MKIAAGPGFLAMALALVIMMTASWQTAFRPKEKAAPLAEASLPEQPAAARGRVLEMRIGVETLRNPFWYAENGHDAEARRFWDKKEWDRILRGWAEEHYNAIIYWV